MAKAVPFEIVPDVTLFGKLGARSRAFPMVVTELIDNSLDSWEEMPKKYRSKTGLKIEITASEKTSRDSKFIITDNAGGMTIEDLGNALTVARSEKTDNPKLIGSFGFGLKSACMYIGSEFDIYTQHFENSKEVFHVHFNLHEFESRKSKADRWHIEINRLSLQEASKHEIWFEDGHGTIIRIKNEKYRKANEEGIIRRVERIFGPRLPKEKGTPIIKKLASESKYDPMTVRFNGKELYASGPFYEPYIKPDVIGGDPSEGRKGAQKDAALDPKHLSDLVIIGPRQISNGRTFWGIAGIIDRGLAHNNQFGFDLIKNGRVIETHVTDKDKDEMTVGLLSNNHNARVVGQLYFDDSKWKTDHQKTEFIKDDSDWEKVADIVSEKINKLTRISSNLQHPNFASKDPKTKAKQQIAEKQAPKIIAALQRATKSEQVRKTLERIDKEIIATGKKPKLSSNSKLLSMRPQVEIKSMGSKNPAFTFKVSPDGKRFLTKVIVNLDHPFLAQFESGELNAMALIVSAQAYAAHVYKEKGSTNINHLFELQEAVLSQSILKK